MCIWASSLHNNPVCNFWPELLNCYLLHIPSSVIFFQSLTSIQYFQACHCHGLTALTKYIDCHNMRIPAKKRVRRDESTPGFLLSIAQRKGVSEHQSKLPQIMCDHPCTTSSCLARYLLRRVYAQLFNIRRKVPSGRLGWVRTFTRRFFSGGRY